MNTREQATYRQGQQAAYRQLLGEVTQRCRDSGMQVDAAPMLLADLTSAVNSLARSLSQDVMLDPRDTLRYLASHLLALSQTDTAPSWNAGA